jgi:hypothetical protein
MTFSMRSFLIVIAFVGVWLGVLVSKSTVAIEVASYLTALLILLTLPLAIWDPRPDMRPFWTGFFVLAAGNYALGSHFSTHQQLNHYLAEGFSGQIPAQNSMIVWDSAVLMRGRPVFLSSMADGSNSTTLYGSIWNAVPVLLSIITGGLGGWIILWISRRKPSPAKD